MATSVSENLIQIFLHVLILVDARESFYSRPSLILRNWNFIKTIEMTITRKAIFACYNNNLFWEFWENLVFLKRVNFGNHEAYSLQLKLKQFLSWTCECNFSRLLETVYYIFRTLAVAARVSWHVTYVFMYWVIDLYSASWC